MSNWVRCVDRLPEMWERSSMLEIEIWPRGAIRPEVAYLYYDSWSGSSVQRWSVWQDNAPHHTFDLDEVSHWRAINGPEQVSASCM